MVGHAFPIVAGLRGGRSVLTFIGTMLVAAPLAALVTIVVVFAGTWGVSRRFDRAARVAVAAFPFVQFLIDGARPTALTGVLMTFVGLRFATATIGARSAR
jgi:glycerol-3-phosphate acyltransferase PlsY